MRRIELKNFIKEEGATLQNVMRIGFPRYERSRKIDKHTIESAEWIMNCRSKKLGGWKHSCDCGAEVIMYRSCHNRSCPVCNGNENREWLEFHRERLVDTKYLHIVFTLPEELNETFLKNKKEMTKLFFEVVNEILQRKYRRKKGGIIITEHTEGSTLTLHPHLHCLIMLGVYEEKENRFEEISGNRYVVSEMEKEIEEEYKKRYKKIEKKLKQGENGVKIEDIKGFKVWKAKKYRNSAEAVIGYFSNRIRGGSISNDRILSVTEKKVGFVYKNAQSKNELAEMELPIEEFIKRVLLHIPPKGQKKVRKYGIYASSKRKSLEKCKEVVEGKRVELKTKKAKKKAERKIEEKVLIFCSVCGAKMTRREEVSAEWARGDYRKAV